MRPRDRRALFSLGAVFLLMSCGSDALAPTLEDIAGTYEATSFVGAGDDILGAGGSLTLTLKVDGSVSGTMSIPASVLLRQDLRL